MSELLPCNDDKKYYWSDDEELILSNAFETIDQAYSDAYCYRAKCFDDPSQDDGFYLHHGKMVDNPEFDEEAYKLYGHDYDNYKQLFEGKTVRVLALTVTDLFHDTWVKGDSAPAAPKCQDVTFSDLKTMVMSCVGLAEDADEAAELFNGQYPDGIKVKIISNTGEGK